MSATLARCKNRRIIIPLARIAPPPAMHASIISGDWRLGWFTPDRRRRRRRRNRNRIRWFDRRLFPPPAFGFVTSLMREKEKRRGGNKHLSLSLSLGGRGKGGVMCTGRDQVREKGSKTFSEVCLRSFASLPTHSSTRSANPGPFPVVFPPLHCRLCDRAMGLSLRQGELAPAAEVTHVRSGAAVVLCLLGGLALSGFVTVGGRFLLFGSARGFSVLSSFSCALP